MKPRFYYTLIVLLCCCYSGASTVDVRQSISRDTVLDINTRSQSITGLSASIRINETSPSHFVRIVLEDTNGRHYLVAESYKEIAEPEKTSYSDYSDETAYLSDIHPKSLKVFVRNASVDIRSLDLSTGKRQNTLSADEVDSIRRQTVQRKVDLINRYNNAHLKLWSAGVTKLSMMPFEDKMQALGFDISDNTGGFEYYDGGIFEVGERKGNVPNSFGHNRTNFPDRFDWTDRHGKNLMTSIKGQGNSNYCCAFASAACAEALVNLYYNQKIDLDLSELGMANCCPSYAINRYKDGLHITDVPKYLRDTGACDESSYPFLDNPNDTLCRSSQINPQYTLKIADYWYTEGSYNYEDSIKRLLINYGPLLSGFSVAYDSLNLIHPEYGRSHAMALVGYGTIHEGDLIRIIKGDHYSSDPIESVSTYTQYLYAPADLEEQIFFKFKNSNNTYPNDDIDGYMYLMFNDLYYMIPPVCFYLPLTITDSQTGQPMYTDADIVCEDADGDGYYNWGLRDSKPAGCPSWIPDIKDGDDADSTRAEMDDHGNPLEIPFCTPWTLTNDYTIYAPDEMLLAYVIVPSGKTLTITGTVMCLGNTNITVQSGGSLVVDGGILANAALNLTSGSSVTVKNGGIIYSRASQPFTAPVGCIVNVEKGEINGPYKKMPAQ